MNSPNAMRAEANRCRRRQRGLSIVELMVGITIGLFIVAAASLMMTTQLGDNRRLLLETQMQQDMRAVADMVARDLRRAGYWAQAWRQVWPETTPMTNPYRTMTIDGTTQVIYSRSTDEEGRTIGTDDNCVDNINESTGNSCSNTATARTRERVGFRFNSAQKTIDYLVGSNWQALTDPAVLQVTRFEMQFNDPPVGLELPCGVACPTGPGNCLLKLWPRDVTVTIVAHAVHEPTLQRTLRDNIRLRNDEVHC